MKGRGWFGAILCQARRRFANRSRHFLRHRCRQPRCIDNEILMYLRANRKTRNDVYLYDSIGSDREGNEINLMDILEYEDEDVVEKVVRQGNLGKLEGYIKDTLTPREWDILKMRYGLKGEEEKTQREIAAIYGISRSYVSRIEKKALEKLRKRYEDNG